MNKPTDVNRLAKGSRITLSHTFVVTLATVVTALATVGIFYAYTSQLSVMRDQLDVMQGTLHAMVESQRFAQKPLLKIRLHEDPEKLSKAGYPQTEEGGERWQLPYFLLNTGEKPAWDIRYWHDTSVDSVMETPDTSEFATRWANDLLFPGEVLECGFDEMLRQEWLDSTKNGVATYRHFFVSYRDENQNYYIYHSVWRIVYTQGLPLYFSQVSYEPVKAD